MFEYKISWIHLHFAVVLILALIVFLAGIETATNNKVGISSSSGIAHVYVHTYMRMCYYTFVFVRMSS